MFLINKHNIGKWFTFCNTNWKRAGHRFMVIELKTGGDDFCLVKAS